jgi:TonB family protein
MKKLIRLFLAVCCAGLVAAGVRAADANVKAMEIPGSGVMPPKTIDAPLPPPSIKRQAGIKVGVWIKEDGTVDAVEFIRGSKEWSETVIATVKKWRFEPVLWDGKALSVRTEVDFAQASPTYITSSMSPLPNLPEETHTEDEFGITKPLIENDPDLILPLMVRSNGQRIEAGFEYVIKEDGTTDKIKILGASSEGALRSGLDMISARKYQPAKIREQPVTIQYRQILGLQSLEKRIPALVGSLDVVDPAYPYERLLAQEAGDATVRFTLDGNGSVISTELVEATHPDFGGALIAAVESWTFSPAAATEQPVREYRHDFALSITPYAARRLIDLVREQKSVSRSGAGLDAKPKMLARPALAYPTALFSEKISGSAKVEFVIDRVGLAQVPRVVSATRPEFGWAAATLVNGMRFEPLTRSGKPTELRVELPITFEPPKPAEAKATP